MDPLEYEVVVADSAGAAAGAGVTVSTGAAG